MSHKNTARPLRIGAKENGLLEVIGNSSWKWRQQFEELRRHWGNADEGEAFSLLCGIDVSSADDFTLSQDLGFALSAIIDKLGMTTLDRPHQSFKRLLTLSPS